MRRILIAIGAVVAVLVIAAGLGLQALESAMGRDRLAAALSGVLHQPVAIGGLSISLVPTPTLEATAVQIGASRRSAPGIDVARLVVAPQLLSLLPGRTATISHVDLVGLVVSVRRTASGQWLVPAATSAASADSGAERARAGQPAGPGDRSNAKGAAPERRPPANTPAPASASDNGSAARRGPPLQVQALRLRDGEVRVVDDARAASATGGPTTTTISAINADLRMAGTAISLPTFSGKVGQTDVTGDAEMGPDGITVHLSSPTIQGADLPALFALAGIAPYAGLKISGRAPFEVTAHIAPNRTTFGLTGKTSIDQIDVGTISLQHLAAPFKFEQNVFTLDPVTFSLYGGSERGTISVDLSKPAPEYTIRTSIDSLNVNQALSATTTMKDVLLGTAHTSADVHGSGTTQAAIEQSLTGSVQFALRDGDIRGFPMLARINQALGVTEGSATDTKFETLTGSATIGGGQARTDDLALHAGDVSVLGKGTMGFDQALNLQLTAALAAARAGRLSQALSAAKPAQNAQGEVQVPLTVTGTVTAPKISVNVGSIAKQQLQTQLQGKVEKQLPKGVQDQLHKLLPKS
jgi:uncharacterized protein involved in outer membrane biogenesis